MLNKPLVEGAHDVVTTKYFAAKVLLTSHNQLNVSLCDNIKVFAACDFGRFRAGG